MISTPQLLALDLVGPDEVARRLEVAPHTVATWRTRYPDFPPPEFTISRVRVWRWNVVLTWANRHGRALEVRRGEVSADDLRTAVELLPTVRAQLAREVRACADAMGHLLEESLRRPPARAPKRVRGKFVSTDGSTNGIGEWDWYWALPDSERARLKPHFTDDHTACWPDQWHKTVAWLVGDDLEGAMAQWVSATALTDAAKMLEAGRLPLFPYQATTTYPVDLIFGDDGVLELARCWTEAADDYTEATADILPADQEEYDLEPF